MGRGKSAKSLELIQVAKTILEEIQPASVRAVCYRLFTMGVIDSMAKGETNRVSTQLTWAREQGLIPWNWIVDETREVERIATWENPAAYVETVKRSYRRDRWRDQRYWLEVWSEKGTVRGTLAPILNEYGVAFRVTHGYTSATSINQVAEETQQRQRRLDVLYVGDWDPSGLHMSEVDLPRRLREYGGWVWLRRLALDAEDIAGDLPFFNADTKRNDPRYGWYLDRFQCPRCWELDALSPVELRRRVQEAIVDRIDLEAWHRAEVAEMAETESLISILNAWPTSISGPAPKYDEGRA